MDMNDKDLWLILLADYLDRTLSWWHTYRLPLILLASVVLWLLLFLLSPRWAKAGQNVLLGIVQSTAHDQAEEARSLGRESQSNADLNLIGRDKLQVPQPTGPKIVAGRRPPSDRRASCAQTIEKHSFHIQPFVFYCSLTGTTAQLAEEVVSKLSTDLSFHQSLFPPQLHDLSYIDFDDFFISGPPPQYVPSGAAPFYMLVIPSYNIDTILTNFLTHLDETHNDFRIDNSPLSSLSGYSVFGIGDKEGWPSEAEGFCSQAITVDRWMAKLSGRKRAYPMGLGDVNREPRKALSDWLAGIQNTLQELSRTGTLREGVAESGADLESEDDEVGDADEQVREGDQADDAQARSTQKRKTPSTVTDLEDVRGPNPDPIPTDFTTYSVDPPVSPAATNGATLKAMVDKTSPTHAALTKQGYTIVGSHSGVKICRWTKSALRGRGSCYKNSFYGIKSHLCMETTPSLSCSNKCVFCWRHGTNPVSTTWRWQIDDPQLIFDGAREAHYRKIKMMRGVPGVRAERFEEAMRIRHCALSLVGEPIFYPRINEFIDLLHEQNISSFLVCNAQHPDQLARLKRVTQLYVSIDASNRDSLRRIDRPLHRDFWERFQRCLEILREKRFTQRTVFRLTLVKGFNVEDEVNGYADLVQKALPGLIEVKGVTYCGTSSNNTTTTTSSSSSSKSKPSSTLTMSNVPFYSEITHFVQSLNSALAARGLSYGIAAEHAHSCCVLLASSRFHIDGRWHTTIDYERFFQLLAQEKQQHQKVKDEAGQECQEGDVKGGDGNSNDSGNGHSGTAIVDSFRPEDYCLPTPEWALWGRGGFDPADQRVDRKGRPKVV